MIGRVVAIPTGRKGDYMDFWSFVKDDGQEIPNYAIRIAWNPLLQDKIKKILSNAKRDYQRDMELYARRRAKREYRDSRATKAVYTARRDVDKTKRFFEEYKGTYPLDYTR